MSEAGVAAPSSAGQFPQKRQTCIRVEQVFDFGFKPISFTDCFEIRRGQCPPGIPAGSTATCRVRTAECELVQVGPPDAQGIRTVTVRITVEKEISVFDPSGALLCTIPVTSVIHETTSLFAPEGTEIQCEVTADCGPCEVTPVEQNLHNGGNGEPLPGAAEGLQSQTRTVIAIICCQQGVCLLLESKAFVKLCVPAEPCEPRPLVQALPPCPPPPLPPPPFPLCPQPVRSGESKG